MQRQICGELKLKVMTMQELKIFEEKQIRTILDEVQEKWYFCVADIISALSDSTDVKQYTKRLRQRDPELNSVWCTLCIPRQFISTDGKKHAVNCASMEGVFRIVQSIPSKKAEPFKRWLAQVGAERIQQMQNPELGIRKDLTDQWKAHNVEEGVGYATLTDIIYQAWAGLTAREYKHLKGLRQENLRDNMTNEELVMNMLAELTTTNSNVMRLNIDQVKITEKILRKNTIQY